MPKRTSRSPWWDWRKIVANGTVVGAGQVLRYAYETTDGDLIEGTYACPDGRCACFSDPGHGHDDRGRCALFGRATLDPRGGSKS